MKILMLTPYLPYPPSSGGQVRSYNLLKHLAQRHEITLFSLVKGEEEKKYVAEIEKYCYEVVVFRRSKEPWMLGNILRTGLGLYPFLVIRNLSSEQKSAVANKLSEAEFDIIHAETFYVMPHIPETNVPILLVDQTIEYQVYQHFVENTAFWPLKPFLSMDVLKLKFWERYFWQKAARVVAVSEDDRQKIQQEVPNLKVEVIPNGVDLDFFAKPKIKTNNPRIFFQGNFTWLQNNEAARILVEDVFPLVKQQIPEVECWIVGQFPKEEIKQLEEKKDVFISQLDPADTASVLDMYRKADVLVAPLYGPGGTRLKILGAMANSLPVVTTSIGGRGIEAQDGREIILRDDPKELAAATVELLTNKALYSEITKSALKLVKEKYSWDKIAERLDKLYLEVGKS